MILCIISFDPSLFFSKDNRADVSFFFVVFFFFKFYIIVLVLPNIKMNPPQVYMYSPS